MITSEAFRGKRYAVLGLARSGRATVDALLASGASVVAWDEDEGARAHLKSSPSSLGEGDHAQRGGGARSEAQGSSSSVSSAPAARPLHPSPGAERSPSPSKLGEDLEIADPLTLDLTGFAGVVVSPGIPINRHPIAAHARAAGVPLIGDIELFAQARASLPSHKVVGITGTNGKSTTTALVHHILKTAGVPTTMGGNIGLPILAQDPLPEGGVYVLELSSYQIDLTYSLDCDVAVLLNITPDHLDRYESFEAYAASKVRLLESVPVRGAIVFGDAIRETLPAIYKRFDEKVSGPKVCFLPGYLVQEEIDLWDGVLRSAPIYAAQPDWLSLQGPHNAENAAAAICVSRILGVANEDLAQGLESFHGLPHRMERVAEKSGIRFINDSKATNAESAAPALAAFDTVHWIVGGRAKTESLGPCADQLHHVRAAYTIGEAGPVFARLLEGRVPVTQSGVLDKAVKDAAGAAKPGEVVLLSPACASFDQFRDFEARGDAFRAAVEGL